MEEQLLRLQFSDLQYLLPELTIVIVAVLLSIIDLLLPKRVSRNTIGVIALVGIAAAVLFVARAMNVDEPITLLAGSYRVDDFANLFKLLFLGGTGLIIFMSIGSINKEEIPHVGEFYYLLLPAMLGAMIMVSSADLITLFVGLELLSITSYILVGMRKKSQKSAEGAFKYIVLGSIASAFILYGMSFLYGMSGSTNLIEIGRGLHENFQAAPAVIYLSFFLMLGGFAFKIAAAPFHQWAPDVYQGAPTPVAAFLAVVSKVAAVAVLLRIIYMSYFGLGMNSHLPLSDDIFFSLALLAATAMILGNFIALRQRNMKRLLAYSGVANAGYLLVPLAAQISLFHFNVFAELYYYSVAYFLMNIGAFAVIMVVGKAAGHDEMSGFAGLYYRAPWTAFAVVLLVLSLAGLPITAGFFGKLYILLGALQMEMYWLAVIMIVTSVISFYYYFAIVKQMFMRGSGDTQRLPLTAPLAITIWICALGGVVLGMFPQWLLSQIDKIFSFIMDLAL